MHHSWPSFTLLLSPFNELINIKLEIIFVFLLAILFTLLRYRLQLESKVCPSKQSWNSDSAFFLEMDDRLESVSSLFAQITRVHMETCLLWTCMGILRICPFLHFNQYFPWSLIYVERVEDWSIGRRCAPMWYQYFDYLCHTNCILHSLNLCDTLHGSVSRCHSYLFHFIHSDGDLIVGWCSSITSLQLFFSPWAILRSLLVRYNDDLSCLSAIHWQVLLFYSFRTVPMPHWR